MHSRQINECIDREKTPRTSEAGPPETRSIVLTGMPGCGKSTLGAILAQRLGRELIDTDAEIEKRTGMSIPEIFRTRGEPWFRDLETEIIREISTRCGAVVATGGGAVLRRENLDALKQNGLIVFLDRPLSELRPGTNFPLADNEEKLRTLYEKRYSVYLAAADVTVPAASVPEKTAETLLERIRWSD